MVIGDPTNFTRLFRHIMAKKYSELMLYGGQSLAKQGSKLLKMLSFDFGGNNIQWESFLYYYLWVSQECF